MLSLQDWGANSQIKTPQIWKFALKVAAVVLDLLEKKNS